MRSLYLTLTASQDIRHKKHETQPESVRSGFSHKDRTFAQRRVVAGITCRGASRAPSFRRRRVLQHPRTQSRISQIIARFSEKTFCLASCYHFMPAFSFNNCLPRSSEEAPRSPKKHWEGPGGLGGSSEKPERSAGKAPGDSEEAPRNPKEAPGNSRCAANIQMALSLALDTRP